MAVLIFSQDNYVINIHKSIDDRLEAANRLKHEMGGRIHCPVLVDDMQDNANNFYGAFPERFYIIKNGKVAFQGGMGPFDYNLRDMEEALKKLI